MRAELARSTKFEGQVTGTYDGDALITGPGFDEAAQGAAQLDEPPRLRKWRSEDVRIDGHNGQICLWTCRDDRTRNTVVDTQFVAEREVETSIKPGTKKICRKFFVSLEDHTG